MIPINCDIMPSRTTKSSMALNDDNDNDKVIGFDVRDQDELNYEDTKKFINTATKKPCAIVVLSNIQNPSVQSLLRKYRYDGNGVLIPSSVKYFIKLPQGLRSAPILVPLNDKAFSPLGGFVRYYKEVPPIPQSW
ncbi:uncharacterized protein LOC128200960 [Galleria mellonella]|uniref:Uncharacterized protein LOC128200960 n=1 Tax=Galleria mellonella TaxID=7137 RepID=A0ABM3MM43_GALME|nr:uncharacterized protein LOC128200960 [Galleria mellonella]